MLAMKRCWTVGLKDGFVVTKRMVASHTKEVYTQTGRMTMAVRAIRKVRGVGCVRPNLTAGMLLASDHPLNSVFRRFCGSNPPTKRQAARFLAKFPQYREVKQG